MFRQKWKFDFLEPPVPDGVNGHVKNRTYISYRVSEVVPNILCKCGQFHLYYNIDNINLRKIPKYQF